MSAVEELTPELLRRWPLPQPQAGGDKDARGRVLIIGGSRQVPGGLVLAAISALRAGAGKLRVAIGESQAVAAGFALPEAFVLGLPETEAGGVDPSAAEALGPEIERADGVLIGPGMMDKPALERLLTRLLEHRSEHGVVLDAGALGVLSQCRGLLAHHEGRLVLTPHAGEMAGLLDLSKEAVEADPLAAGREAAARFSAVVIVKGQESYVVGPDGRALLNRSGHVGLATSGSGDTLGGLITGLLARGAEPMQAAAWGVRVHAEAGAVLGERYGGIGYLARELPEIFTQRLNALQTGGGAPTP